VKKVSVQNKLGKDPAPSAVRYLVLTSGFTSLLMAISFIPVVLGTSTLSTEELDFYQNAIPAFFLISLFTFVEWFFLRRSRKITGPYGFAIVLEILKTLLFNFGSIQYTESVPNASSSSFFLLQITSYAILFSLVLTKVARTQIDQIARHDLSRQALNLLPTFLVLALFLGTYVTEITGLGIPRQRNTFPEEYEQKDINWDMFNTPTWDATYLLVNLLDQFTAGLSAPDIPLFYVTSGQNPNPFAYWRLGSLELYKYTGKAPYSTDWDPTDSTKRVLTPYQTGTPYSEPLPEDLRTAQFNVRVPLNYEDSIAEITIHPNFPNYLPVTWNGMYGSYVDTDSFALKSDEMSTAPFSGTNIATTTKETREVFPNAFASDLLGVDANIRVSQTSNTSGTLQYTVDYQFPQYSAAATFSLNRTDNDYRQCVDSATWSAIKSIYLQLPNKTGQLPNPCTVWGVTGIANDNNDYSVWAPSVYGNATAWNDPSQDVFGQAFANMMQFQTLGVEFDQEMWLGQQVGVMDHPAEYEDYNEWFFRRGEGTLTGVSLHFASSYTTICRLQGIPSRVVIGYAGGNDSYFPYNMISSRYLHAWSEVLIPVKAYYDPVTDDFVPNHVEWIPFDPLVPLPVTFIRGDYDLESEGFAQAYLEEQLNPGSVLRRCVVNNSAFGEGATITNNTRINVSVRLISVIPPDLWIPIQGQQISFYVGTDAENITGNIWETGTWIGNVSTNSRGIATLNMTVNVFQLGIRPVKFWAVTTYAGQVKLAESLTYNLSLF